MRVLLVDDDAGLRALLRTTFDVFEIEVEEATSAEEARALIHARPPDVIVLDVLMPGLDGIEFCRQLKSDRETRGIGVVLLSGTEGGARAALDPSLQNSIDKLPAVVKSRGGSPTGA